LLVVGIGPGGPRHRTLEAVEAIGSCDVVAGYTTYLALVADLTAGKSIIETGMRGEVERCRRALASAQEGNYVAMVCSGDAGIYGMAGLVAELADAEGYDVQIEIVPGVTACSAAAAALGAPLMCDFAVVSLSDLLIPWDVIVTRLRGVAAADLVTALYNPRSRKRLHQLDDAVAIFREHRAAGTPVGIVTAAGCDDETCVLTDLAHVGDHEVTMRSVVIVGNSRTKVIDGRMVTTRGYRFGGREAGAS
jgi:precorrin-3B C17-methyltransferase